MPDHPEPIPLTGSSAPSGATPQFEPIAAAKPAAADPDAELIALAIETSRLLQQHEAHLKAKTEGNLFDSPSPDPAFANLEEYDGHVLEQLLSSLGRLADLPASTPAGTAAKAMAMLSSPGFFETAPWDEEVALAKSIFEEIVGMRGARPAAGAEHPDAPLFQLCRDYWDAHAAGAEKAAKVEDCQKAVAAEMPAVPSILVRDPNTPLGRNSNFWTLPDSMDGRQFFIGGPAAELLRETPRTKVEGDQRVPDPDAQAEVDAVLVAHDVWLETNYAITKRLGLIEAIAAQHAQEDCEWDFVDLIYDYEPRTVEGLALIIDVMMLRGDAVDPTRSANVCKHVLRLARQPFAVECQVPMDARKPDRRALLAYREWLEVEGRLLAHELFPELGAEAPRLIPANTAAVSFHFPHNQHWGDAPQPSTRAEAMLDRLGIDWRQDDPRRNVFDYRKLAEVPVVEKVA